MCIENLFYYFLIIKKKLDILVSTFISKLLALLIGIHLGKKCHFHGIPIFRKIPNSSISIGDHCIFNSSKKSNFIGINRPCIIATISRQGMIQIGNSCGFSGVVISSEKEIIIGNNVRIGANSLVTDTDWHSDDCRINPPRSIYIHNNVWIGTNVTILKGVTIGQNSIIGANTTITHDVPPNVVLAGNPPQIIRKLIHDEL